MCMFKCLQPFVLPWALVYLLQDSNATWLGILLSLPGRLSHTHTTWQSSALCCSWLKVLNQAYIGCGQLKQHLIYSPQTVWFVLFLCIFITNTGLYSFHALSWCIKISLDDLIVITYLFKCIHTICLIDLVLWHVLSWSLSTGMQAHIF